jgi:hypothetical protein
MEWETPLLTLSRPGPLRFWWDLQEKQIDYYELKLQRVTEGKPLAHGRPTKRNMVYSWGLRVPVGDGREYEKGASQSHGHVACWGCNISAGTGQYCPRNDAAAVFDCIFISKRGAKVLRTLRAMRTRRLHIPGDVEGRERSG